MDASSKSDRIDYLGDGRTSALLAFVLRDSAEVLGSDTIVLVFNPFSEEVINSHLRETVVERMKQL